ncbi:hypothetical protein L873DRAFT_1787217 [Choiromyces venosus 120613-1]|uniref:Uncharacterized protein n=1 Tax=Choiromyces venosus 120613-1 TaxID=1336337 RepID=A0A3N4JXH9_9PEZI|nr:hypothetical protein L873DRAFT_1787217 [Choiromyces venosus 120613-1]
MPLQEDVTRAQVYRAILNLHGRISRLPIPPVRSPDSPPYSELSEKERNYLKAAHLRYLLERLLVVLDPHALPQMPHPSRIESDYPDNMRIPRFQGTLTEETKKSDADEVSRVVAQNEAKIVGIRENFLRMMRVVIQGKKYSANNPAVVLLAETLAEDWTECEEKIEWVRAWYRRRWRAENLAA